jgi:hypothetical protein
MAATNGANKNGKFLPGPAAEAVVSLSQAILGPLDALAKAQVHAARSFLNFVLQLGYPHLPWKQDSNSQEQRPDDRMYVQSFKFDQTDAAGKPQTYSVDIPALALVPLQPLTIEKATFDLELVVSYVGHHQQIQSSEREAVAQEAASAGASSAPTSRPWYLVSEPVSIRGTLSDPGRNSDGSSNQSTVKVHVELARCPTPEGLSKLLSAMTQRSSIQAGTPEKLA